MTAFLLPAVFGALNIIKAFVPSMIEAGPLPSGKPTYVVTTSSVVGLFNGIKPFFPGSSFFPSLTQKLRAHSGGTGPYIASKMAATALCEHLSIELQNLGDAAAHVSAHSLHPSVGATNFFTSRDES
eukprot:COSAG04_NODE_8128_length_1020_cov_1.014115_2_plen_126_part_01